MVLLGWPVEHEELSDDSIESYLAPLGLSQLAEWDVLAFLYRHHASLASTEEIVRLLGYNSSVVGDALDLLESRGMVERSHPSRGVRLYQFLDSASPSHDCFKQLAKLAESRSGRLVLAGKLRQRAGRQPRDVYDSELGVKGSKIWPKAV